MDADLVKSYYANEDVLSHYMRATNNVGLWQSEKIVFTTYFEKDQTLLELGTGTGRIAFGLERLGYRNIMGIELSQEMVKEAQRIAKVIRSGVSLRRGDATKLKFDDNLFDGAIFGFNGLMQIPKRKNRILALQEVYRVIAPGSYFIFTTHDRNNPRRTSYWKKQLKLWNSGEQDPRLDDFGDRYEETELGQLFIHVPVPDEIRKDLKSVGFKVLSDSLRSNIARENPAVQQFSDECRFWVAQKPKEKTDL